MPVQQMVVTAALILRAGWVLVARRPAGAHLAGAWEFPGGRVEPGEHPERCLEREIAEELGCRVQVRRFYDMEHHVYADAGKQVFLLFYRCDLVEGEPRPVEAAEVRWVECAAAAALELAPADQRVARRLAAEDQGVT